ncbi:flagellar biosynthesis protein FlhB [Thermovibrio ammonificans]
MAKDPSKTEKATPRRRQKAREEGQVLRSQDLSIAFSLVLVAVTLFFYLPFAFRELLKLFNYTFEELPFLELNQFVFVSLEILALLTFPVFLVLLVGGVLSNVVQFGFLFTLKPLVPKLDPINPVKGFQRLFSLKTLFELVKSLVKLGFASAVGYFAVKYLTRYFTSYASFPLEVQLYYLAKSLVVLVVAFALLAVPVAGLDFLYRRWEYEENLKMSKQEVKEERKQYEGHPLIKSEIRKRQRQLAMRRMMAEVPKADVVITNPEHYAVALKYERGKMHAPKVVAKGVDSVALKIKEIALEHGVPVEENPPLARALYESCEVGDFIPEEFYRAVARILAKIYRRRRRF